MTKKVVDLVFGLAPVSVFFRRVLTVADCDQWHVVLSLPPISIYDGLLLVLNAKGLRIPVFNESLLRQQLFLFR